MNRRGFLTALVAAVTGAAFDPERLLWVPGKKLISIPAVPAMLDWSLIDDPCFRFRHPILLVRNTSNETIEIWPGGKLRPWEEAYVDSRATVRFPASQAMIPFRVEVPFTRPFQIEVSPFEVPVDQRQWMNPFVPRWFPGELGDWAEDTQHAWR